MLSNSSGLLRYGPETVLRGSQRFLPPVWAFNLAGHSTTAKKIAAACPRHSVRGLRKNMDFRRLLENIDSSKTELWTILNIFVCIFDVFSVPINSSTREI